MPELKIIIAEDKELEISEINNNTVYLIASSFWSNDGIVLFELNKEQAEKIISHLREQFKL